MATLGTLVNSTGTSSVRFFRVLIGRGNKAFPLQDFFKTLIIGKSTPLNLTEFPIDEYSYQIRDLHVNNGVWSGCFGKLKKEAPHVVGKNGAERPIGLSVDDRILEKSFFTLHERTGVLSWSVNQSAGGYTKFKEYISKLAAQGCKMAPILDQGDLNDILSGEVKELIFSVAGLNSASLKQLGWNGDAMRLMRGAGVGSVKFKLAAPKAGKLKDRVIKPIIKKLASYNNDKKKISVRIDDQMDPIDIFLKPLKDNISYQKSGHYPIPASIIKQLDSAHDLNKHLF